MKKLTAFGLSAAMMMSMSSVVFAEETTMGTGDQEIDVHAKYEDNTSSSAVYSVDVSWGAMEFTYTEDGTLTWDPSDHTYIEDTTSGWIASGNGVTVTNHSNVDVSASFNFEQAQGYESLNGDFDVAQAALDAGVENGFDQADSVTSTLTLSGELDESVTDFTKVGTVTVEIK